MDGEGIDDVTNGTNGARDPALVLQYGKSKLGKSTDDLFSFPRGLHVAARGALNPAFEVVGFMPPHIDPEKFSTIFDVIALVRQHGRSDYDAIIVDDFSILSERTYGWIEKNRPSKNEYAKWDKLRDAVIELCDAARTAQMHVVLNAHERGPREGKKGFFRGGPNLPCDLTETLPGMCDVVVRAEMDNDLKTKWEANKGGRWPVVYRCTVTDPDWVSGDRNGGIHDRAPMNIGEGLRNAGFTIRRAPGFEWQEAWTDAIAKKLLDLEPGDDAGAVEVRKNAIAKMQGKVTTNPLAIRWTLRDAVDRVEFRRAKANVLAAWSA